MSEMGQTEKNSVRAYVFRFALELGHCSTQSACLKRAKNRTRGPCLEASTLPMEKRPNLALVSRANGLLGTMTRGAIARGTAGFLLLATPVMAAEPPAELISNFRLKHGEVRVVRDAALDRIALEQARAMAAKDNLRHAGLGSVTRRIAPARAGRAAENIAYGCESFEKTLGQWIDSS